MTFTEVITQMTQSAAQGDGKAVAACFTEDGIYHDRKVVAKVVGQALSRHSPKMPEYRTPII